MAMSLQAMMSNVLRAGGLVFILSVAYLAKPGSTLFSFHPLLMTVGFTGLMTEAIFMFSKFGLLTGEQHNTKVTAHWIVLITAGIVHGLGIAAIYINKENNQKPHFSSWHGNFGLTVTIFLCIQLSAGGFVKYPKYVKRFMTLKTLKKCHGLSGTLTYTLGLLTIVLSLWSVWFQANAHDILFYFALILHILLIVIVCWKFIRKFFLAT